MSHLRGLCHSISQSGATWFIPSELLLPPQGMGDVDKITAVGTQGYFTDVRSLTLCVFKSQRILLTFPRRLVARGCRVSAYESRYTLPVSSCT